MVKEQVLMRKYVNSHLGKSSPTTFINPQLNLQKTPTPTFTNPLENGPTPPAKKGVETMGEQRNLQACNFWSYFLHCKTGWK